MPPDPRISDSKPDREGRPADPARLRVELTRVGNYLSNHGIGDGAAAVDAANRELDRLRAENEALRALETREDANAATLRAEHERDELRAENAKLEEDYSGLEQALDTEMARGRRDRAENERLREQLRREQIIASALANISHVIDKKQSGADVIHAEDCPACAASQRIADALALSFDEQGAPRCVCPSTDFKWCPVHPTPERQNQPEETK